MKKLVLVVMALTLLVAAAGLVFADKGNGKFEGKAGDVIYVCACGEGCKCGTLAKKAGECGCGQKLVETKVTRVDKGKVCYLLDGKELSAPQQGKYMCGCGEGCNCGFISQKAGKCGCGTDMVQVTK